MKKIPYRGKYPKAAELLMEEGVVGRPRQVERKLQWAEGIDIIYPINKIKPAAFNKYSDAILMLAYQEAMRYEHEQYKFASIDVRLGRLKKGRDIPEIATFGAGINKDAEIMVWGPGYDTPDKPFLVNKVDDIIDITSRYPGKINKQNPYTVIRLTISIRAKS